MYFSKVFESEFEELEKSVLLEEFEELEKSEFAEEFEEVSVLSSILDLLVEELVFSFAAVFEAYLPI